MSIFISMGRYSYKGALELLTDWATNQGYGNIEIDYHDTSNIEWVNNTLNTPRKINIEGKHPIEIKTYLFLHELGHHQLRKDWNRFKKTIPVMAHAEDSSFHKNEGKYKRRVTYTVACMEEEFKAWEEGYKLGIKLGIRIDMNKWNQIKSKCLISYMRYYSLKKH